MGQYSGSPSDRYASHPPAFLLRTPRACWSTHGPGGARAACGAPGQTGWGAEDLILQTIEQTRAAGWTGLVRHKGNAISPPLMDDALTQQGFEKTEGPDILVFELGTDPDPKLPDLPVPHNDSTWRVRDRDDRLRLANVVEAGVFSASTWSEADTRGLRARALRTRRPPTGTPERGRRRVRPLASAPRPEPPRRRTADRGCRWRGTGRRDRLAVRCRNAPGTR